MSSYFNITPFNPLIYKGEPLPDIVDEIQFISSMKHIWPEIQIWETPAYGGVAAWELNYFPYVPDKDCMQGSVNKDGQLSLSTRGWMVTFAKLAVWYRSYIPAIHKLYMWWDSDVNPIELTSEITVDEFIKLNHRDGPNV